MKLLTLVLDDFQDIELTTVLSTLEKGKIFSNFDYYNPHDKKEILGQHKVAWVKTNVSKVVVDDYEAIFVPGGKAALYLRDDQKALNLIGEFKQKNKKIFAICDAPNALYEKGIIKDCNYTAYPLTNQRPNSHNLQKTIVHDQNFFTSKCAFNSFDLALMIIEFYKGKAKALQVENSLKGIL